MRAFIVLLILFAAQVTTCAQEPLNFSWSKYNMAAISTDSFSRFTPFEKKLSSEFADFTNNHQRLRFLSKFYKPDLLEYDQTIIDQFSEPFISLPCKCISKNDTLYITTAIGLFSGLGLMSAVTKDSFGITFYNYLNEKRELSLDAEGKGPTDNLTVPATIQKITLSQVPSFRQSEILIGLIEAEFKEFYRYSSKTKKWMPQNYTVALQFMCRTRVALDYR